MKLSKLSTAGLIPLTSSLMIGASPFLAKVNPDTVPSSDSTSLNFNNSSAFNVPLDLSSVKYNPNDSAYDDRYYQWASQQADLDRQLQRDLANQAMFSSMSMANMQWMGQTQTNQMNYQMNRENLDFQQKENDLAREREDTAAQRRAIDLAKAGLSKTLAAGSPASSQAMVAPSYKFAFQNPYSGAAQFGVQLASAVANIKYLDSLTNLNNINASTLLDENVQNLRISESKAGIMALSKNMSEDTYNALVRVANLSATSSEQDIKLKAEQIVKLQLENNMLDFEDRHKAISYWIDNLTSVVGAIRGTSYLPSVSNNTSNITSHSDSNNFSVIHNYPHRLQK